MKTKQEKIKVTDTTGRSISLIESFDELLSLLKTTPKRTSSLFLEIVSEPEPKDKALQEYIGKGCLGISFISMMQETNNRILDLEAAVARLEAGK